MTPPGAMRQICQIWRAGAPRAMTVAPRVAGAPLTAAALSPSNAAGHRVPHPVVYTILYFPFGALGGFIGVALTFLGTRHGLSISESAFLNGASMMMNWLKWIWAPLVAAARQGQGGRFAFLSSVMGRIGGVTGADCWLYRVSKAALNMAVATAQPAYPRVTMVAMHPGWVQTDMGGASAPLTVTESVRTMIATLEHLTPADRGRFLQHDGTPYSSW